MNSTPTNYLDALISVGNENEIKSDYINCIVSGIEMLRISNDGFYVRGKKVAVDDKEAETVYNAFKQFLVWAELNRR